MERVNRDTCPARLAAVHQRLLEIWLFVPSHISRAARHKPHTALAPCAPCHFKHMRPNQFIIRDIYRSLLEDGYPTVAAATFVDKLCENCTEDEKNSVWHIISLVTDQDTLTFEDLEQLIYVFQNADMCDPLSVIFFLCDKNFRLRISKG